jgi:putative ABC transport system permease protein
VTFYRELMERISSLPGVQAAGAVSVLPLGGDFDTVGTEVEGQVYGPGEQPSPERYLVTPDYFKVMQIGLVGGRTFSDADNETSHLVMLVSKTAAERWWPGQNAIGKRMRLPGFTHEMGKQWRAVVGVVEDVKQAKLDAPRTMQIYVPHSQSRTGPMVLAVRTDQDALHYASSVRQQVSALDRDLAVSNIASMEEVLSDSVAAHRFSTVLLGLFAALGLLLAAVGVYGILSYSVAQRTREIGIRMALGAARTDVLSLVAGQGLRLALIGIAVGMVAAFTLTRLMSGLLFEVSSTDPSLRCCCSACRCWHATSRRDAQPRSIRWWHCGTSRREQ